MDYQKLSLSEKSFVEKYERNHIHSLKRWNVVHKIFLYIEVYGFPLVIVGGICTKFCESSFIKSLVCIFFVFYFVNFVFVFCLTSQIDTKLNNIKYEFSEFPTSKIRFNTFDEVNDYLEQIDKRYNLILGKSKFRFQQQFPLIQQLCRMNPGGRNSQKYFINDLYGINVDLVANIILDREYTDADINFAVNDLIKSKLSNKQAFIDILFKLAIVDDGIHNDEWYFLLQLMSKIKFNQNYIEYFKNRYSSLRTEFGDFEMKRKKAKRTGYAYSRYTYLAILGLDDTATEEDIRRAYISLVKEYHPDLAKNASRIKECEEMMAKINEAYSYFREDFNYNENETSGNTAYTTSSTHSRNPYLTILGLDDTATIDEIRRAYHNLALEHHPDLPKNAGRIKECEEMMAKINEAYEKVRG